MTKDQTNRWKVYLCCGVFIWFIINLLQAVFTEIHEDEAYYVLYGEHLAWGYFDHPPMVGLMTFLSSQIFQGLLGVRFLTVIASAGALLFFWILLDDRHPDPKKTMFFFTIAFSVVMFNVYGFVTTPDVALIVFSALFLWAYREYLQEHTWSKALLMGFLMACMIYSKYHAFLLLGLVVLSNLKLLKDGKFYVAGLLALVLLVPHILWQVNADFPSFRYHLVQRSEPFQWSYFLEYLPNQLLVFNPFTFVAAIYVLVKHKSATVFERGLRFILVGFILFFWLMSFRGHVEPHWTIVCVIPIVVLIYHHSQADSWLRRYVKCAILPSLILVAALRVVMLTPLSASLGFYGKERHYQAIAAVAGDCPVAFQGSFQPPALYHFFTGKPSTTLRSYYDRKTQFDLWQFDNDWQGQRVFVQSEFSSLNKPYHVGEEDFEGFFTERFQSANRLVIGFDFIQDDAEAIPVIIRGDTVSMDFSIFNPYPQAVDFRHEQLPMNLMVLLLDKEWCIYPSYSPITVISSQELYEGRLSFVLDPAVPAGENHLTLAIGDRISIFSTIGTTRKVLIQ